MTENDGRPKVVYTTMKKKNTDDETKQIARRMAAECLAVRIRFMGRVITSLYDQAQKNLDITINQANILVFLILHPGASPGAIGRALQMEKSTVSRSLDRMKKKEWIEVAPGNARGALGVRATAGGNQLLASLWHEWQKTQEEMQELMGNEGNMAVHTIFNILKQKGYGKGIDL